MKSRLIEAVHVFVRYDTPDEHGETRRERNAKYDEYSPDLVIPDQGNYLWDWFHLVSRSILRVVEGSCAPIPHSEWQAWSSMSGNIVNRVEYAILTAMDAEFCRMMNIELVNLRAREAERREKESKNAAKKKR